MHLSMHQSSIPRFTHTLNSLSAILDKAVAHAEAKKIKPEALTTFRLYPDMLPFTSQIQIACDAAKGVVARLAGVEVPKHEDTEVTFADLKARIAKTIAFIDSGSATQGETSRPASHAAGSRQPRPAMLEARPEPRHPDLRPVRRS